MSALSAAIGAALTHPMPTCATLTAGVTLLAAWAFRREAAADRLTRAQLGAQQAIDHGRALCASCHVASPSTTVTHPDGAVFAVCAGCAPAGVEVADRHPVITGGRA